MPYNSKLSYPSMDVHHKPGQEGSCPPETTESIGGKSFPNGDQMTPSVGSVELPKQGDLRPKGGEHGSPPTPAMPGA